MIKVKLNKPEFEYDIHSLVKAFYPEGQVVVSAEEKATEEQVLWQMTISYQGWEPGSTTAYGRNHPDRMVRKYL